MRSIGSSSVVKIVHVVHDLEKVLDNIVKVFGIERPAVIKGQAESREASDGRLFTSFKGRDIKAPVLLSNVNMGPIVIEVVQPLEEDTPWGEFLKVKGDGIYSVVYTVKDFHGLINSMGKEGMPNFHRGEYPGGRYGYWNTQEQLGFTLGLQEFDE